MVNHAPSGTLFKAEVMYSPSKVAKTNQSGRTKYHLIAHTFSATSDTKVVVMTVSRMTQTP
jgi:hypothetical protein